MIDLIPGIDYVGVTTSFYCNDGKGNFLLHKRSKNCRDEQGNWDPGGGKLDHGLDIEQTVLKEIQEEYGVKGTIQEQLPAHDIFRDQNGVKTHWVCIPFFVLVDPKKVINNEPHKIDEIGWFRLDDLPIPLHTGFSHSFKKFHKYFQNYT